MKKTINILFYSWKDIPHSYGIVSAFLLIHLYKNYGPNGKIKKNGVTLLVQEAPYFRPHWIKKLTYTDEYNNILNNLKIWDKKEKIDIIYSQTYPYDITRENVPKIVFYTSEFSKLSKDYFLLRNISNFDLNFIKNYLNENDNIYFTSPSKWSENGMKELLYDDDRNRIITHGVDTSIFKKHNDNNFIRDKIRKKYNIQQDDILLINIGAMTTNKGILLILEALHILVNKNNKKQYKLMLKGSGELYSCKQFLLQYFEHFQNHNIMNNADIDNLLNNHIIFTEKMLNFNTINDLFNASDLYISPYLAEGFGLTMLEALSSGLRILVPQTGSTSDYINQILNSEIHEQAKNYIYFVNSYVSCDGNGLMQNNISVNDLIHSINSINFNKNISETEIVNYIDKHLSWNYVSTLLYEYIIDILL